MADSTGPSSDLARRSFERVLLVKPSSLGDVVHALPVLHGLRVRYPRARIDWLIAPPFAPLLEGNDELDGLVLFDRRRFGRLGLSPRVTGEFIRFVRGLRDTRYDLVIDLQGLFRTGFIAFASGAPVRIGFRGAREGAWMFYSHRLAVLDGDIHAVDRNYQVGRLLGFADVPIQFRLALTSSDRDEAAGLLRSKGFVGEERMVALVPGARWETKCWPAERFARTIEELQASDGVRCVLLGGVDEVGLCERIIQACRRPDGAAGPAPVNLAGRTTVRQLAAVIELADVVLCQDSAAMHLAVVLGRPLVCLIGPTNPRRTGPYQRLADVVCADVACSPCYLRRLSRCGYHHQCMKELDSASVAAALRRQMERKHGGHGSVSGASCGIAVGSRAAADTAMGKRGGPVGSRSPG